MRKRLSYNINQILSLLLAAVLVLSVSCSSTKYLGNNQYLLRKNSVGLTSVNKISGKGEMKDNLARMITQKPNTRMFGMPFKLLNYYRHANKLHGQPVDSLPKYLERPAIYDTLMVQRSMLNMKKFMFSQGYFYAKVSSKTRLRHKHAYVSYKVESGYNYVIDKVNFAIEDSAIAHIVKEEEENTLLLKDVPFKYSLLEDERSRIISAIRDKGYYHFTQENINFLNGIDTVDKSIFKDVGSLFEGVVNSTLEAKTKKKHTVDLTLHIQLADDTMAFRPYTLNKVNVYPDYNTPADLKDSTMIRKTIKGVNFIYHSSYIHPNVLFRHIYLNPGDLYSQSDFDKSIAKLNELGIFQYVRILPYENRRNRGILDYDILLKRNKKHDFTSAYEISSGSTYFLGNSLSINYRDRNLLKGANLLTIGINGGLELSYNDNAGKNITDHFSILTKYYGVNASVDFPKFLAPIAASRFDNSNLPHTIISGGENVMDRINYFTLVNTSANFAYNWRQDQTTSWTFAPAFINIIKLPLKTDSFQRVLDSNAYLRNSYKENFIEGESINYLFDNIFKKYNNNHLSVKLGLEEAGGLLSAFNSLGTALNDLYKLQFAQYVKFDFEAKDYIKVAHSQIAIRFYGGVGRPYGQSVALPYIKQYFAGGPYSLRGWRIRTLGPGSYYNGAENNANQIDRTGDIKLEFNTEFRFPIAPLFAGAIKMNGALFADAGNIWLAHADPSYPGGEMKFETLGRDIAADAGMGLRFDIASFLTLRVDLAIPVKKPYVSDNGGWVFYQIAPGDATWRSNNIIFNISIGYPF